MEDKVLGYFKGLRNKNIAIVGFGVSNRPLVDLLLKYGAKVTVCDKKKYDELKPLIEGLESKNVKFKLGEDYLNDLNADIIFKTPGMRSDNPAFIKAEANGSIITSEMEVFFSICPCRIIAVTGSDGKTTTTTIIYNFLTAQGFTCHLGGNIGKPLLPDIFNIKHDHFAVVELSSFQLQAMSQSPYIAVMTNIQPNHLDWHTSMDEYIQAKENIFKYQRKASRLTLNADNAITCSYVKKANGEVNFFSMKERIPLGTYLDENGDIYYVDGNEDRFIMSRNNIALPGDHNVENYMAAISATWGLCDIKNIINIARTFTGVEHRMEFVRDYKGVKFYNDSIASSPTRTIACLKAQSEKIIMIAGGYDKKIPYEPLAPYINEKVKCLVLMGLTAPKIEKAVLEDASYCVDEIKIIHVDSMEKAVLEAYNHSEQGDKIYLSPASASFDSYPNFEERGLHFKNIVKSIEIMKDKE